MRKWQNCHCELRIILHISAHHAQVADSKYGQKQAAALHFKFSQVPRKKQDKTRQKPQAAAWNLSFFMFHVDNRIHMA
ncbi:hypothetical protein A2U01_0041630 [Trifolium medium]|uniref:Uncharacterized protein n=1 Tax=Trifolium medium TaxID=97028 RepID=A0A392Q8K7_9FABA|nr:hypothetical protein [Trifolium medium]